MKKISILVAGLIGLILLSSCEKEYHTPNFEKTTVVENNVVEKSTIYYTVNSPLKAGISGSITNGQKLKIVEETATVLFYTMPKDKCTWIFGNESQPKIGDQISHTFGKGVFYVSVYGDKTAATTFSIETGAEEGGIEEVEDPIEGDSPYSIYQNIILAGKQKVGNNWELTFHIKNQRQSSDISSYGHVGQDYIASSWTPTFSGISFHGTGSQNVLVFKMLIANGYNGNIKFCLSLGSDWFSPDENGLGGKFFNSTNPGDKVWQFNFNSSNGSVTSWNGEIINVVQEEGATASLPGNIIDENFRFSIANETGGDESLTIFIRTEARNFWYESGSNEKTSGTLSDVVSNSQWKAFNVPKDHRDGPVKFDIGNSSSGVFTRVNHLDGSINLFNGENFTVHI